MKDIYKAQFFRDITEIRKNMTGLTGTGELVAKFETPQFDREMNEYDQDIMNSFKNMVIRTVGNLNNLTNGRY